MKLDGQEHDDPARPAPTDVKPDAQEHEKLFKPGRFLHRALMWQLFLLVMQSFSAHVVPVPSYPGLHEQEKLPTVSVHAAFLSQLCEPELHSSTF